MEYNLFDVTISCNQYVFVAAYTIPFFCVNLVFGWRIISQYTPDLPDDDTKVPKLVGIQITQRDCCDVCFYNIIVHLMITIIKVINDARYMYYQKRLSIFIYKLS